MSNFAVGNGRIERRANCFGGSTLPIPAWQTIEATLARRLTARREGIPKWLSPQEVATRVD
jgi:hypothetical protein